MLMCMCVCVCACVCPVVELKIWGSVANLQFTMFTKYVFVIFTPLPSHIYIYIYIYIYKYIYIIIIFLQGLGRLTCSGIEALPLFPRASTISSFSRFVVEGVFRKSGVVHSFRAARLLRSWVRIPPGHGYLSVVSVVCCQVEVTATG